ncbi:MAG: HlyC/CorC family transporter [Planctomycetota bacterium]|nr:MAG: HlyC/CorC family transporter [Planctomycetota bacterium]
MHEPPLLFLAAAGAAESADAPAWTGDNLLLPALLLAAGAVLGGLRALLSSPLAGSLLEDLPEERRRRLREEIERDGRRLVMAAGIGRLACVVAAATLVFGQGQLLEPIRRWPLFAVALVVSGLLLEGVPALVVRGRLVRPLLLLLPPLRWIAFVLRPLTALLDVALRAVGADPEAGPADSLAADLIEVAQEQERESELDETERRMIAHVIDLPEVDAAEVMTPRTELTSVPTGTSLAEALRLAHEAGHSRILVHEGDIDHVVGVFYLKDALPTLVAGGDAAELPVDQHLRQPFFVPETMRVPALLEELRRRRVHLAVVVDEYGGTAGVVTVEDLLEEIVGEIEDEHDPEGESLHFERRSEDEVDVDGRFGVPDLNELLSARLPEDKDYDTVAGLLFDRFGHIPAVGEAIELDGVRLEVLEADDRRIRRVRVRRLETGAETDAA